MLFDTRYFWSISTEQNPESVKRLRRLFEGSKDRFASSINLYEVYRLSLAQEGREVAELRTRVMKRSPEDCGRRLRDCGDGGGDQPYA